ncbi:glutathione peroxidase domain-containing protein [Phthorimaea operculella]|nr:glutathione peroxidase domain-containing protein [Phthorimaea operculella]
MVKTRKIKQYQVYRQASEEEVLKPLSNPDYDLAKSIYDFSARDLNMHPVKLDKYIGKVCIIVNVASKCPGFTYHNYKLLNHLYEKYAQHGLQILAFPCNQFNHQESGTIQDLKKFIHDMHIKFDVFAPINVNCNDAHPLWKYLKTTLDPVGQFSTKFRVITDPFTKYIVGGQGLPVARLQPGASEEEVWAALQPFLHVSKKEQLVEKTFKIDLPPPQEPDMRPCMHRPWRFTPGHMELI